MGWVLEVQSPTNPTTSLQLLPGTAQVGRAQTAQIRSTHQSVSRVHAEVVVQPAQGSLSDVLPLEISITDRSSTGHTFVNDQQPGRNNPMKLSAGDVLHFGVDPLRYTVHWRPMLFSISSRLGDADLQSLHQDARSTGVFVTSDWTAQCTHLLLEQFSITPKLLCCIIDGAPPVSMSFLSELSRRAREKCELLAAPSPADFSPQAAIGPDAAYNSDLNAYIRAPRPRRELLRGIWVIFSVKADYERLCVAISCAGSPVQILTQDQAAQSVLQDLNKATAKATPKEVWIIPTVPPGLRAVLSKPLQELRCPFREVGQEALVGAILSGSLQAIHGTAGLAPKVELQESFPETQPTNARTEPSQGRRQLPWEKASVQVKEESFPNTLQEAPGQPPVQTQQQPGAKKVKTELEEKELQEAELSGPLRQRKRSQQVHEKQKHPAATIATVATVASSKPASQGPERQPAQVPALRQATQPPASQQPQESSRPEASLQMQSLAVPAQPKIEEKEEKANFGTVHSSAPSLPRQAEVKAEEAPDLTREVPIHPTNTWLPKFAQKSGRGLVLDGVELPRATYFATTKRRPETVQQPQPGKPNFKRFRKAQRTEDRPFVEFVPWAPARGLDVFCSQPTLDTESQMPRLAI